MLTPDELVRAIRFMIAAESESIQIYTQLAASKMCIRDRYKSLAAQRAPWETWWDRLRDYVLPRRLNPVSYTHLVKLS